LRTSFSRAAYGGGWVGTLSWLLGSLELGIGAVASTRVPGWRIPALVGVAVRLRLSACEADPAALRVDPPKRSVSRADSGQVRLGRSVLLP
jgi:hypothetical protein